MMRQTVVKRLIALMKQYLGSGKLTSEICRTAYVVEMSVSQHHRIQATAFQIRLTTILRLLFLSTLEHAAVDKNTRITCHDMIRRPGHIARRSVEMYFHTSKATASR